MELSITPHDSDSMDLTGLMRLWRHEGIMTVVLLLWSKVNFRPASCFRPWAPRSCRHSHHRRSVSQASRGLLQWHHRNGSSSSVGTNDAAQIDTWWLSVFPSAAMLMTIHEVRADSSFFGFITLRDSILSVEVMNTKSFLLIDPWSASSAQRCWCSLNFLFGSEFCPF